MFPPFPFPCLVGIIRFEKNDILRIVRALAIFRPSLIALQMPLSVEDEVFVEKCFQRSLLVRCLSFYLRFPFRCLTSGRFELISGIGEAHLLQRNPNCCLETHRRNLPRSAGIHQHDGLVTRRPAGPAEIHIRGTFWAICRYDMRG